MFFQPRQQRGKTVIAAPAPVAVHKGLGVQKIGVYQAGIKHPRPKGALQSAPHRRHRPGLGRKLHAALPAFLQVFSLPGPRHSSPKGIVRRAVGLCISNIRKSRMMPRNAHRRKEILSLAAKQRPRRRMVHSRSAVEQTVLEARRAFSIAMGPAGQLPLWPGVKRLRKCTAQLRRPSQVFLHRLAAKAILRNVGVIFHPACSLLSKNKSQPWIKKSQS